LLKFITIYLFNQETFFMDISSNHMMDNIDDMDQVFSSNHDGPTIMDSTPPSPLPPHPNFIKTYSKMQRCMTRYGKRLHDNYETAKSLDPSIL